MEPELDPRERALHAYQICNLKQISSIEPFRQDVHTLKDKCLERELFR